METYYGAPYCKVAIMASCLAKLSSIFTITSIILPNDYCIARNVNDVSSILFGLSDLFVINILQQLTQPKDISNKNKFSLSSLMISIQVYHSSVFSY